MGSPPRGFSLGAVDGPEAAGLLERAAEVAAIDAAVRAAISASGRLLVVDGPAGIGKTALLEVSGRLARERGMEVLTARGGELEREFGFGVVGQLFEAAVRLRPDSLLTGRARLAVPVLGVGDREQGGVASSDVIFPSLQGLFWLTVNLTEERPLALLVDDAHLADAASIRFLAYLAQRLDGLPVLIVAATHSGTDGERVHAVLPRAEAVRPQALSASATETLVRSIAPQADAEVCAVCHVATGGNALFVRELARAVRDEHLERGPATPRMLLDWSPERVTRSVTARLANLPPQARELAHAVAVLGQDATLRHAAALARLEPAVADAAADGLRAAGILAPGRALEFAYPIVRAAVHDDLAPAARARAHGRAAALLAAEHTRSERVAIHILHCEPAADPANCEQLIAAAGEALTRGSPEAATTYLRRALEEPPPTTERARVLLELATAEALMFNVDAAADHLRLAFDTAVDRETRLRAALLAASLSGHNARADEAIDLLTRVRGEFADQAGVATSIQAHIANAARFERAARIATLPISRTLRLVGEENREAAVLAAAAAELSMVGEPADHVARVSLRGLDALNGDQRAPGLTVHLILIRALVIADRVEQAGRALEQLLAESRRSGSVLDFAFASVFRADLMYRRGELSESEADARAAYEVMIENSLPMTAGILAHLVNALVERGELAEAEAALLDAGLAGPPGDMPALYTSNLLLFARGRLRAAAGDHERALEDLLETGERQAAWVEDNPALIPWRSEAALAYHALGRSTDAARLAEEEVILARRYGAPRAIGIALDAAAGVTDREQGLELASQAVAVLAGSPARLEHARALATLGGKMQGTATQAECRAVLSQALELSHICGAAALEQRILTALRGTGARPRRMRLSGSGALTPSELRVAQMAARGMANREIAESLFLTVRTIEFHLRNCYRKLRVSGRRELRAALDAPRSELG